MPTCLPEPESLWELQCLPIALRVRKILIALNNAMEAMLLCVRTASVRRELGEVGMTCYMCSKAYEYEDGRKDICCECHRVFLVARITLKHLGGRLRRSPIGNVESSRFVAASPERKCRLLVSVD